MEAMGTLMSTDPQVAVAQQGGSRRSWAALVQEQQLRLFPRPRSRSELFPSEPLLDGSRPAYLWAHSTSSHNQHRLLSPLPKEPDRVFYRRSAYIQTSDRS